jgi:IS605 OrfB family transposase
MPVVKAKGAGRGLALENLKGIRHRTRFRKPQRARMGGWAFHRIRTFVGCKAQQAGVDVVVVDPRNTSRQCPVCGPAARANRPSPSEFRCVGAVDTRTTLMRMRPGTSVPGRGLLSTSLKSRNRTWNSRPLGTGTSLGLEAGVVDTVSPIIRRGNSGVTVPGQAVAADIFHDVFSETSSRKTRITTCIIHLHGLLLLFSVSGITPNHTRHNIDFAGCQVAPAGPPGGRWFQAGPPRRAGVQVRPGLFRETGTGVPPAWMPWMPARTHRLVWGGGGGQGRGCPSWFGFGVGLAFGSDRS